MPSPPTAAPPDPALRCRRLPTPTPATSPPLRPPPPYRLPALLPPPSRLRPLPLPSPAPREAPPLLDRQAKGGRGGAQAGRAGTPSAATQMQQPVTNHGPRPASAGCPVRVTGTPPCGVACLSRPSRLPPSASAPPSRTRLTPCAGFARRSRLAASRGTRRSQPLLTRTRRCTVR